LHAARFGTGKLIEVMIPEPSTVRMPLKASAAILRLFS
jgi:hypothetical protein